VGAEPAYIKHPGTEPVSGKLKAAETAPAPKSAPLKTTVTTPDDLPFMNRRIVINIPSRTLWVYQDNAIIRYFPVGVGRPGFMTPVGHYAIISKVVDPGWENPYLPNGKVRLAPGEDNPLGTRWMGFYEKSGGEYGMHGTDNPASVGKFSSHGCVRMKVKDAEALFDLIDLGTPVEVVYQPVLIRTQGSQIRVTVYADRFKRGMPSADQIRTQILKQYPTAKVDFTQLQAAIAIPNERPIPVGSLPSTFEVQQANSASASPSAASASRYAGSAGSTSPTHSTSFAGPPNSASLSQKSSPSAEQDSDLP